jgi:pantoate--beta-alanine ligase
MTGEPRVLRTRAALAAALAESAGRRGVVMTMGALHEGHLSLVRRARELADQVVVTVFVNPLQFGPQEDLERYPRDLAADVALLAGAGADLVFAPAVAEMFPNGEPSVTVSAGPLGDRLEGAHRPGHFDGVLTIVLRLCHLTRPDVALFGQKDAQQLVAVRRMVVDLDVGVQVVACPTVRDADGVALSSRNDYLDGEQRGTARALYSSLQAARRAADDGAGADRVRRAAEAVLRAAAGLAVDYVALVSPDTAEDVADDHRGPALLAIAARVGSTRLIDNEMMDLHDPREAPANGGEEER